MTLNWDLRERKLLEEFDYVKERVEFMWGLRIEPEKTSLRARGLAAGSNYGYDVVNLKSLRFSSSGQVMVPGQGILDMSKWARQQLGSEIGVRWDKFFEHMDPEDIQHAVMSHLHSQGDDTVKKVISREHEKPNTSSVGVLRGFVSPSYAEISDCQILDRMQTTIGKPQLKDMGFFAPKFTDRGSFLRLVYKEPLDPLPELGGGEKAAYGLSVRNSEVGAFSLTGDGFIGKLLCSNGMILRISEDRWLYRRHRHIEVEQLDSLLDGMFQQLVDYKGEIEQAYNKLYDRIVPDPEEEIRSFMARKHRPKVEREAAVKAFYVDSGIEQPDEGLLPPPTNSYTIMQAIARLGASIEGDVERQHDVESLAGDYMWHALTT